MNLKQIWTAALGELQVGLPRSTYDTWFKDTQVLSEEDDVFLIGVPNAFAREWLENKFRPQVRTTLQHLLGRTVDVRFVTSANGGVRPGSAPASTFAQQTSTQERREAPVSAVLNQRYTFSTFVVGSNNRLAHAAALSVAERPGHSYNPLFVYGGSGLGKTHLMHAIGHAVIARHPKKRVAYATSEKFTNEFINSIRAQKGEDFRERYRRIDVLLVDDIQFIAGKEGTQEEFFHTFNAIHEEGKQIVISSDRPPKAIQLEDRLRSRFEWGLIADISTPDLETRIAILRAKAEVQNVAVPPPVIDFLAQRIVSNIRELEGALTRIVAYAALQASPVTTQLAQEVLQNILYNPQRKTLSPERIAETVARYYGVPIDELKGRARDKQIVLPRQIAMYLMREETEAPLLRIGEVLGGRDHSTVLHGCEKIEREMAENDEFRRDVGALREMLYTD
ncbi:MAG: chromosomal replication initiator protein DnaA [Chloroflexi bacterium]|nr:MAG: chromosomal replication initiator protein DnaA [Chloroflexota bacterium]TMG71488.1 MAG: chromosomal replication initiator protein DnaA [Chloroflexota bacterium]